MPSSKSALLSQGLMGLLPHPADLPADMTELISPLPQNCGYVVSYGESLGDGRALFISLEPGIVFIKFEGKFHDLDKANALAAGDYINSRVFSLRIAERGQMEIFRGKHSRDLIPGRAVLSCYDGQSDTHDDIIRSPVHSFNHFLFTEDGLRKFTKETGMVLPTPLASWLATKDLSAEIHSFEHSRPLSLLVRALNLQTLSFANNRDYLRLKYQELFLLLGQALDRREQSATHALSEIQTAYNMVMESGAYTLTTTQAARLAQMPRARFDMAFHAAYGERFADFVQRQKFEHAARMLQDGAPLSDIVLTCGYTEQSNFSRAFKRYFGVSPTRFVTMM